MKATYWMFAGLGILTAVAIFVLASPGATAWYTGTQCPASGDWTVSSSTKYYDETLNVNGNLYVNSDLTLTNCIIRMNTASIDGGVTINVASGASLTVYGSSITSNNGAYHYKFTVYGSMWINQSQITEAWGNTGSWMGGIQLYSSSVWIGNSSIYNGKTGGISISKCSPWIYNNNIYSNGASGTSSYAYGIYALGDSSTKMNITTNRIYQNTYSSGSYYRYGNGIRAEYLNSNDAIYGNNIYDNGYQNYVYYNYGYQVYLYFSNPTMTNNRLTNGQYQLYCYYSNPPTINGGTISGFAYYYTTTYGVYATSSGLTFANVTFTTGNQGYTQYGIYSSSYSPINVTDCKFDYQLYGSYDNYAIYLNSYSPAKVVRCNFYQNAYSTVYPIYAYYYSDIEVTNSNFYNNGGYYYGVYGSYNCKVNLTGSKMSSINSYYGYMIQVSSYSPLRLEGCTLDIEYSYYDARLVQASSNCPVYMNNTKLTMYYTNQYMSAYQMYAIYTYSSSPVTMSNVTATFEGTQCYYWYMFYVESSDLTINNTKITDTNNYIYYYYYMFYTGWSSGNLVINNVTVDFTASLSYQWGGIYITQGYNYGSSVKLWANKFTLTGTCNGYFYGLYWGYGSVYVNNSNFDIRASGQGFYFTQTWYGDFEFRNTVIKANVEEAQYGSILQGYTWNDIRKFVVDNCTIYYSTSNTAGSQGGVGIFRDLNNMDADITNTTVTTVNTDGVVGVQAFNVYYPQTLDVVNCTFKSVFGYGTNSGSVPMVQWGWFYQAPLVNFTRCNITIDIVDQAMTLDTFYIYDACGDLNFNQTNIYWNIDAAGAVAGFVSMSDDTWSPGSLNLLSLKNSKLSMVVTEPDCKVSLLKITPSTKIGEFRVAASQVDLEYKVASSTPTTAIQISGSDVAISDLKLNLKAPAATQTEIIGLSAEGGSPTFKNIVVQGNGNGRMTGIVCGLATTASIDGCRIDGVHTGIAGDFFAMPMINNTTVDNCNVAISMQNLCNGTVAGSTIKGKTAVQLRENARVNMYKTTISGSVQDWELNGSSTAWLLDCTFKPATSAAFLDTGSRLVVNWYLQLRLQWQNGREIPGAAVVMRNAPGSEFLRTVSDVQGVVPWFIVVEYVQTQAAKTMYSPYTVNVTSGGVSGEQAVTTDKSKEQIIIIRDDLVPVVEITEPAAGAIQNFVSVTMLGTASDIGSGLDYIMISHDGTSWVRIKALPVWVEVLEVPEGTKTLTVKLYDKAGNEGVATREIIIDLTKPFIRVDSPADKSLGNVIGVDLAGAVEPGSLLTVNFRPVSVTAEGGFSYPVRLVEGRNDFVLFATDRAGNTNTTTWTLYLDITPPPLAVTAPRDGLLTNQKDVTVSGKTEAGASITVNDKTVETNPDGTFSTVLELRAGPNFVTVVASDAAGNHNTVLRSVVLDNELRLDITAPADKLVTTQVTILVIGSTDTDALVRINGGVVSVDPDGNFSVTATLEEGWNTLVFSASDRAGNTRSLNRTVLLDTVAPVVEIGSPASGAMLRDLNVAVSGICEPGITLTVNGQPVDTSTGVFNTTVTLPEGASRIVVEGRDEAGNRVSFEVPVTIDSTRPSLIIVEPSAGFRTTDRSVLVVGLTEPGARVLVNDVPAVVDAFGRFTVQLTLARGSNTVSATSTDAAGNTANEKVTVKVVDRPAAYESGTWWWTAIGLLLALGIMIPLTMYMVNSWQRARIEKEGSK